jgi:hypothetical protein
MVNQHFVRPTRRGILVALLVTAFSLAPFARRSFADAPKEGTKTVHLLSIGNSFSGNATKYLADIAKANGDTLDFRHCSIGGSTMQQHWDKAQLHEKDPKDPEGLYSTKKGLKEELASGKWDYVTIQQASIKSHDVSTYRPYAKDLYDYVKKYAPQAEVLIHQTWEYRVDDPRFNPSKKPPKGEPATSDQMYEMLTSAYKTIASELNIRRMPVGDAFHAANHDPKWSFKPDATFDPKTAKPGALPDQTHSLNMGWKWGKGKDGKESFSMDGHHASTAGEYLGGLVWYEVLFGKSVVGNKFIPKGLDPEYARFLQEKAHEAVVAAAAPAPEK